MVNWTVSVPSSYSVLLIGASGSLAVTARLVVTDATLDVAVPELQAQFHSQPD